MHSCEVKGEITGMPTAAQAKIISMMLGPDQAE